MDLRFIHITDRDLDGRAARIVSRYLYESKQIHTVTSINTSAGEVDAKVIQVLRQAKGETIIITDLYVSQETAKELDAYNRELGDVYLFDHHHSAVGLQKYQWAKVELNDVCGASLYTTWLAKRFVLPVVLTEFIEEVRLYDTWTWENISDVALQLNLLYGSMPPKEFEQEMLAIMDEQQHFYLPFYLENEAMQEEKRMRYMMKKAKEELRIHNRVGFVYVEAYQSEIGNYLCQIADIDVVYLLNKTKQTVSIRTIKDINVAEMAAKYGGGGHLQAAGCLLSAQFFNDHNIDYSLN